MKRRVSTTLNNIRLILTREQREVLRTAFLLMIPIIMHKILGLLYNALSATMLGNGVVRNAFTFADAIPEAMTDILFIGFFGALLVPVLMDAREDEGHERFLKVYNTLLNTVILLFIIFTIVLIIVADRAMPWLLTDVIKADLSSLAEDPTQVGPAIAEIANMMKVLLISGLILGISSFVSTGLQSFHRVLVPQLSPLFYNMGRIVGVAVLLPLMNNSPWALVYGVMIGAVLHLLVQFPLVYSLGISYRFVFDWRDKYVRKIAVLSIPRGIAMAGDRVALLMTEFITTRFGAISAFDYGSNLAGMITAVFGHVFAHASLPVLSELYSKRKHDELAILVSRTINQIIFLAAPFIMTAIILRLPVVRLVLGFIPGTAFTREDTALVAWILLFMSVGVIFASLKSYLYRVFFAAKRSLVPALLSLGSLGITMILGVGLSNVFSHNTDYILHAFDFTWENLTTTANHPAAAGGLALAIAIAAAVEVTLQLFIIDRYLVHLNLGKLVRDIGIKLIPISAMSTLMFLLYKAWDTLSFPIDAEPGFTGSTTFNLFLLTSITVGTSFMVYYLMCFLFQVEELKILRKFLNPVFRLGGLRIG